MSESRRSPGNLLTTLAIGAAVGAGLTFLFGTNKGKELRKQARKKYPEVFSQADKFLSSTKLQVNKLIKKV